MKFRFPIVIIDEDYRAENTSGLGIRALAKAIEEEDRRLQQTEEIQRGKGEGEENIQPAKCGPKVP